MTRKRGWSPAWAAAGLAAVVGCGGPPFMTAPHAGFPQIPANSGDVMDLTQLCSVVTAGDPLAQDLLGFGDQLIASKWWPEVTAEYGVGPIARSTHATGPALTSDVDLDGVAAYVSGLIQSRGAPAPDGHTLYVLYLPPGVSLIQGGQVNTGCQQLGGYHAVFGGLGDGLALAQRCPPGTGLSALQATTLISSHEVVEAATDPSGAGYSLGQPLMTAPFGARVWQSWASGGFIENGDLCEGARAAEGGQLYQRIYSNRAAALGGDPCVPAATAPYYNVSAPMDWYPVQPGAQVSIPLSAWSTAATANWLVYGAVDHQSAGGGFGVTVHSDLTLTDRTGKVFEEAGNGRELALLVQAPSGAASGAFAVVKLYSVIYGASFAPPGPTEDEYHAWPVGVYVP